MQDARKCLCSCVLIIFSFKMYVLLFDTVGQGHERIGTLLWSKRKTSACDSKHSDFCFSALWRQWGKRKRLKIHGLSKLSSDIYLQCLPRVLHVVHCAAGQSLSCILEWSECCIHWISHVSPFLSVRTAACLVSSKLLDTFVFNNGCIPCWLKH